MFWDLKIFIFDTKFLLNVELPQNMKEENIFASNATIEQLQREVLLNTKEQYPCRQCNYQANTKGDLDHHQKAVQEGVRLWSALCGSA